MDEVNLELYIPMNSSATARKQLKAALLSPCAAEIGHTYP